MKKCPVCDESPELSPVLTKQGVEVDICLRCDGVWLDRDEIYHFTRRPVFIRQKLKEGLEKRFMSSRKSPINGEPMMEVPIFDGDAHIHYCPNSHGIWIDKNEFENFPKDKFLLEIDEGIKEEAKWIAVRKMSGQNTAHVELTPLPNLAFSSGSVLVGMYGILTFLLVFSVEFFFLDPSLALMIGAVMSIIHFALAPFLMDFTLKFLYKVQWLKSLDMPGYLQEFIVETCSQQKIKQPRIGLIPDGAPQAFTYGHTPSTARIVISQGLLDLLDEEEVEAVIAHEFGHIMHWDMLVMTFAQLVPLVLYYIYRALINLGSTGKDKSSGFRYVIAIGAYILYIVSEYVVLWFSRIREYYADRFAGQITKKPNKLASALVKIGYGLAGEDSKKTQGEKKRSDLARGLEPLGIFNTRQASALAISRGSNSAKVGEEIDKEAVKDIAKWDLWNPWAKYYELHSTHPLIAKRIQLLGNLAKSLGQPPFADLNDRQPETYWDDFFIDLFVHLLPTIIFIVGLIGGISSIMHGINHFTFNSPTININWTFFSLIFIALGIVSLFKVWYSYPNVQFPLMNIKALLKKIKVSAVSPVPCKIKGKIIGRGIPGLIYSEDFVLQDDTGIIFLDYQQPFAFVNFFFGLLRAAQYQNKEAEIIGWYRRAPIPYIEIKEMNVDGKTSLCYVYHTKVIFSVLSIILGIYLFIFF